MKILLASNNAKKRKELERILQGLDFSVVTPKDLGLDLVPEEDGATFAANARIKALAFGQITDLPVLADDSGLVVDALAGEPGVHSARYAGLPSNDAANREKLLAELAKQPSGDRRAHFVCALALFHRGRFVAEVEGRCSGRILDAERGDGGFGYDPLFLHEATGKTLAELDAETKDRISHRGAALRMLTPSLHALKELWN